MLATASRDQLASNACPMAVLPSWQPVPAYATHISQGCEPHPHGEEPRPFVMRTGYCAPGFFHYMPNLTRFSYASQVEYMRLVSTESRFYADVSPLLTIDSAAEDMVDATMRDESLVRLLNLHRAFYDLSPITFIKAVALVDTFITHVKVKPKYMMCVAAACYYIVSKFEVREPPRPTVENLVRLTNCGGTPEDLVRMVDIILTKLGSSTVTAIGASSSTALDYLRVLLQTGSSDPDYSDIPKFCIRQLEMALCTTTTAFYRPCILAVAFVAAHQNNLQSVSIEDLESQAFKSLQSININDLYTVATLCSASWLDVETCMNAMLQNGTLGSYSVSPSKSPNTSSLNWAISRRTKLRLTAQTPPSLNSITEFTLEEEEEE